MRTLDLFGGEGKEGRCCIRELFAWAKIFLERTWGNSSYSWARLHVEPRTASCWVGARGDRGSCSALSDFSNFPPPLAAASGVSPISGWALMVLPSSKLQGNLRGEGGGGGRAWGRKAGAAAGLGRGRGEGEKMSLGWGSWAGSEPSEMSPAPAQSPLSS